MSTVQITRKSRIGFGWNTNPTGSGTEIHATTSPKIAGTVRAVIKEKRSDRVFQSLQSCYKTIAWFVRVNGEWKKIISTSLYSNGIESDLCALLEDHYEKAGRYMVDSVTATI